MKKIVFILFALSLLMSGCSKNQYVIYEDEISSKAYIIGAGSGNIIEQNVNELNENDEFSITIYCAGNNSSNLDVKVTVDQFALEVFNIENNASYSMLPEDCFEIVNQSLTLNPNGNYKKACNIRIDKEKIVSVNIEKCLIPISLKTESPDNVSFEGKTAFIKLVNNEI